MIQPGQLLVAHPEHKQGFFARSVVLITENHAHGTVGLAINHQSEMIFADVMTSKGIHWPFEDKLYRGGPVNPTALVCVHTSEWYSSNTLQVSGDFAISSDHLMTEKMSMGNTPSQYRFVSGISGWAPGQLEHEMRRGSWLTCWATPELVFGFTGDQQWRKSIDCCAREAVQSYF